MGIVSYQPKDNTSIAFCEPYIPHSKWVKYVAQIICLFYLVALRKRRF